MQLLAKELTLYRFKTLRNVGPNARMVTSGRFDCKRVSIRAIFGQLGFCPTNGVVVRSKTIIIPRL